MLRSAPVQRRLQSCSVLALVVGGAACGEPPSLRVRWALQDRDGITREADAAQECSELGINAVRVRIIDEAGEIVDDEYHACFARRFADIEQTVAGPELDAGLYGVEVRAVQRNLEPFGDDSDVTSCSPSAGACKNTGEGKVDAVCECEGFEARDDQTARLMNFLLSAPDECTDGIDNDADGVLDAEDPSCTANVVPPSEFAEVTRVQFRVTANLLGGNGVATCSGVGLSDISARVCQREAGADLVPCEDVPDTAVLACRNGDPVFFQTTLEYADDIEYTLELVGRGPQGTARTTPALFPVELVAAGSTFVAVDVDFAASMFDPPIEAPASVLLSFADGARTRDCVPAPGQGGATLTSVRLEILDAHGGELPSPVALADGTLLDGTTDLPCPTAKLVTESLAWGGWSLRASARTADGTVCYRTNDPFVLAPEKITLVVPAVLGPTGEPPASCVAD